MELAPLGFVTFDSMMVIGSFICVEQEFISMLIVTKVNKTGCDKIWAMVRRGLSNDWVTRYLFRYYRQTLKMKLYLYEKCESCRKATRWLDEKKVQYEKIPIREKPPTKKELSSMLTYHEGNIKKLFNTSSKDYRDPSIKEVIGEITDDKAFELLIGQGNLVKRPVLVGEELVLQGFKPEQWEQSLG
jgi:arsenate reductase